MEIITNAKIHKSTDELELEIDELELEMDKLRQLVTMELAKLREQLEKLVK